MEKHDNFKMTICLHTYMNVYMQLYTHTHRRAHPPHTQGGGQGKEKKGKKERSVICFFSCLLSF